ncbi:hypothetical protein PGIGA_G00250570 [Pangasianodon gigas]|uniref:Uncharacterized protein n=1 Tax=Pangasianodon gigas TaxID=30993 RepID=A0ACC5WQN6_PANGG|nr:hypothetical protein [Pangasianodon gigas]
MESMQYDRFTASESESAERYHNEVPSYTPNRQNRRIYIMFGVLTVFLILLTLTVGIKSSCENDWVFYKNKCYYTSTQRLNWHDAEKNCIWRRGHLLVVNDLEEMEYVSQLAEEHLNYWIGLVEREGEGNWSWVDGTDFKSTEHFWDDGQPDDWDRRVNGEDCGQIHAKHKPSDIVTHRLWNDADCTLSYKYICERPA